MTVKKITGVFFAVFILLSAPRVWAEEDYLTQADALFVERADLGKAFEAVELYAQAVENDPQSVEAAWKLSRAACWATEHLEDDRRLPMARRAMEAAERAVALAPNEAAPHFYLGLSMGYYGHAKGVFSSLAMLGPVMDEMETVIAIDPSYDHGAAYLALGRLYSYIPKMFGGGNLKAIKYYRQAIQYGPQLWGIHLFMAEALIYEERFDEARALLQQLQEGPPMPGYEAEYKEWYDESQYLMDKIRDLESHG